MKKGYGFDRLSRDVLILSAVFGLIALPFRRSFAGLIFSAASTILIWLILFRTLSSDVERRQDELLGYEKLTANISAFFKNLKEKSAAKKSAQKDPNYKYFDCPECGKRYRAPKGKGRIRVTCTECGAQFEKKV